MFDRIREARDYLASRLTESPKIGLITGTGLGVLTERMDVDLHIPYGEIPHFPLSTSKGHGGHLFAGRLSSQPVIAMDGRFHLYEGYSAEEVALPVRVMTLLGAEYLFISSAAGGLNPHFERGDLMVVRDHINLTGTNPLRGANLDTFGPRFPDMSGAYPLDLLLHAKEQALELGAHLREGTYAGIMGPSLETPAETRFLRMIGADAVGMSTVTEVIAGVHCGLKIMAIVVITNVNLPDCMKETSIEEVIAAAEKAGPILAALWERIIVSLPT